MQKIISLFQRNYGGDRLVRNEVTPGAEWVIAGEGIATQKFDGTCCMVRQGQLYKRYDAKAGKIPPEGFEPAQPTPDPITGHWPGWVLVGNWPEDRWHIDARKVFLSDGWHDLAFNAAEQLCYFTDVFCVMPDGTYELCGPKLQGNPEHFTEHVLVAHGAQELSECPLDFDGLKAYLSCHDIEGVVWHHPDGRMVKIKARDFGIKRGVA